MEKGRASVLTLPVRKVNRPAYWPKANIRPASETLKRVFLPGGPVPGASRDHSSRAGLTVAPETKRATPNAP
jgi:hypothetical protein